MRISELVVGNWGPGYDLHLDGFHDGLNVLYGGPGIGKSQIAHFISHTLSKANFESISLNDSSGTDGLWEIVQPAGRLTLDARDEQLQAGLDSPEREISPGNADWLFNKSDRALIDNVFHVVFDGTPGWTSWLSGPAGNKLLSKSPPSVDKSNQDPDEVHRDHSLNTYHETLRQIESRIETIDHLLIKFNYPAPEHRPPSNGPTKPSNSAPQEKTFLSRLDDLDQEILHWQKVLNDCHQREQQLQYHLSQRALQRANELPKYVHHEQASMDQLYRLLGRLRGELSRLENSTSADGHACLNAHPDLLLTCESIQVQVDDLNNLLRARHDSLVYEQREVEFQYLARCRSMLQEQLTLLSRQRDQLTQLVVCGDSGSDDNFIAGNGNLYNNHDSSCIPADSSDAVLGDHSSCLPVSFRKNQTHFNSLIHERKQLLCERNKLRNRIRNLPLDPHNFQNEHQQRNPEITASVTLDRASDMLRDLTGGQWVSLRTSLNQYEFHIVAATGQMIAVEGLPSAEQDLIRLCMSLVLASQYHQEGIRLPLILDDPFRFLSEQQVDAVAKLLLDDRNSGIQLITLTGHRAAAERFRQLGIHLHQLPSPAAHAPSEKHGSSSAKTLSKSLRRPESVNKETDDWFTEWEVCQSNLAIDDTPPRDPSVKLPQYSVDDSAHLPSQCDETSVPLEVNFVEPKILKTAHNISNLSWIGKRGQQALAALNVCTMNDLLDSSAYKISRRLSKSQIHSDTIRRWQSQALLMLCIPGLDAGGARMLVESGISSPEELIEADEALIHDEIQQFIKSDRGQRLFGIHIRYDASRLHSWIVNAHHHQHHWQSSRHYQRSTRRQLCYPTPSGQDTEILQMAQPDHNLSNGSNIECQHPDNKNSRTDIQTNQADQPPTSLQDSSNRNPQTWQFNLTTSSRVVDAPSIGPRTAQQLQAIGIRTIKDLLNRDADSIARQLDNRRLKANLVRQWQQQACLLCRVPQLQNRDALILVACGIETPEKLQIQEAVTLFEMVEPFAQSKEGQRIIRNGQQPNLATMDNWITWSNHCRPLKSAA